VIADQRELNLAALLNAELLPDRLGNGHLTFAGHREHNSISASESSVCED
jgi:hypothetical protein